MASTNRSTIRELNNDQEKGSKATNRPPLYILKNVTYDHNCIWVKLHGVFSQPEVNRE